MNLSDGRGEPNVGYLFILIHKLLLCLFCCFLYIYFLNPIIFVLSFTCFALLNLNSHLFSIFKSIEQTQSWPLLHFQKKNVPIPNLRRFPHPTILVTYSIAISRFSTFQFLHSCRSPTSTAVYFFYSCEWKCLRLNLLLQCIIRVISQF